MVKTAVTHSERFTFWGSAGDQCLLTPHLIKYVLKVVPKINFLKTGHLNVIKKIIFTLTKDLNDFLLKIFETILSLYFSRK